MTFIEVALALIAGHAIADYALQSDWMAKAKNRNTPAFNVPAGQTPMTIWPYVLTSHAAIHGAAVGIVTGYWQLALAETVAHWLIDFGKCENRYGIHADQWLHFGCKALWIAAWWWMSGGAA